MVVKNIFVYVSYGLDDLVRNISFRDDEVYGNYLIIDMVICNKVKDIFKNVSGIYGFVGHVDFIESIGSKNYKHYIKVKVIETFDDNTSDSSNLNQY